MMPFACCICCIRIPHIQNINTVEQKNELDMIFQHPFWKAKKEAGKERASSFITQKIRGSLTIETALVLPFFLFAMLLILMLSDAMCLHTKIQGALHQNVKIVAQEAYVQRPDETALYHRIIHDIGSGYLESAPIEGGSSGISFEGSKVGEADLIEVTASYQLQFPFDLFQIGSIPMVQRCLIHEWVGYGGTFHSEHASSEEEYVYVTPYGTVYHRSPDCTHIKLSIQEVSAGQIADLRNTDGGKYKCCEQCHCSLDSAHIYITDTGDRYHDSLTCSGLKRNVIAIPLSEVGGRAPCSRCGMVHP